MRARLCVLASGSGGNCSVLVVERPGVWGLSAADEESAGGSSSARVCLIDLGLSPRRTFSLLAEMGVRPDQVDDVLLTHFDNDHLHRGWLSPGGRAFPRHTRVHVHRTHARRAERCGLFEVEVGGGKRPRRASGIERSGGGREYDGGFALHECVRVDPIVMDHDDQGVVAFRFDFAAEAAEGSTVEGQTLTGSLGFATDLGRVTPDLTRHLRGVNVLAIESNYCPQRQQWSGRPEALKQRIMGGNGHLSNEQALEAISAIGTPEHVVLLHLSRECNCPEQVRAMHEGSDYALTISSQFESTRWVRVAPALCPVAIRRSLRVEQPSLFVASETGQARAGVSLT